MTYILEIGDFGPSKVRIAYFAFRLGDKCLAFKPFPTDENGFLKNDIINLRLNGNVVGN